MNELENNYSKKELNILISGHRCTIGCIGAYFEGIPTDGNILKFSSDTGYYNTYNFKKAEGTPKRSAPLIFNKPTLFFNIAK
ncbi:MULTISPECIES: hypothetical protein [Cytobacillus]|uniref:hypothetical protein n=1 Tax=Cytobacillus TaxID=2675230 RepID=UPI002852E471|nr:hypothetical protein [Cytobacillus firmus]